MNPSSRDARHSTDLGTAEQAPKHLTQIELARRWHLSRRTLEKWRTAGLGPKHLKIGGRVRYRVADIEDYEVGQERVRTRGSSGNARHQLDK